MARLKALGQRVANLPSRLPTTAEAVPNYGQGRGGRPWRRLVEQVKLRDQYTCRACGLVTEQGHCDHIVPRAEGGSDDMVNLQWLCIPCHDAKTREEAARGVARRGWDGFASGNVSRDPKRGT